MAGLRRVGDWIANRYEIYDIRAGGMGVVYVVYDHQGPPAQRVLALKSLRDEFLLDRKQSARFITECRAWIKLERHPHIVRAYSVQEVEGKPHAVLELVTGGDLRRWIGTPRLDLQQILRFGVQFCLAMEHAVQKGLHCHRDIKPENLLITEGGSLKITDFGLAKVRDEAISPDLSNEPIPLADDISTSTPSSMHPPRPLGNLFSAGATRPDDHGSRELPPGSLRGPMTLSDPSKILTLPEVAARLEDQQNGGGAPFRLANEAALADAQPLDNFNRGITRVGAMLGTGPYMAPEQFRDAKTVDLRADIYSFGIVLFEMITGKRPFNGDTFPKLAREHARAVPGSVVPFIAARHVRYAKGIDRIVQRCLEKDPAKRYGSYGEFRRDLAKYLWRVAREKVAVPAEAELEAWELTSRGVSLGTLGRSDEERASYEESFRIKPDYVPAWFNQAAALGALGRFEEALEYSNVALSLNPRSVPALINKGLALACLRRHDEAIACFDAAVHVQPRDADLWYARAVVLIGRGSFEGAKAALKQALRLRPSYAEVLYAVGVVLARTAPWLDAQVYFQRALEAGDRNAVKAIADFASRRQLPKVEHVPWVRRTEDTPPTDGQK